MSIFFSVFFVDEEGLNNIIKSVVREHHFTPEVIDALFFDNTDYHGLIYWYEDILEVNEQLNKKK